MIDNLEELIDALAETTREHVAKEIARVRADHAIEVADLKAKLSAALTKNDVTAEVARQVGALPPAEPGKSVTLADVAPLVDVAVEKRMAGIVAPKAEEVDYDRIGEVIAVAVDKAFTSRPWPKDVDMAVVTELIKAAAITAMAALPKPEEKDVEGIIARAVTARVDSLQDQVNELRARPQFDPSTLPKALSMAEVSATVAEQLARVAARYATPEDVDARVKAAIGAIPEPLKAREAEAIAERVANERFAALPPVLSEERVKAIVGEMGPDLVALPRPAREIDLDDLARKAAALIPTPKNGDSVHPDTVRVMVQETLEKAMATVRTPKDGERGRDAADLEILDSLSAAKSYPKGTFGRHDGGVIYAFRDTDPVKDRRDLDAAGWRVAQDGIKGFESEIVDERTHRLVAVTTSGKRFPCEFVTSYANMDKGVHRPGMKYRAGDGVSKDGSFWISQVDDNDAIPGDPPHANWRLAVKKGRDAR